MEYKRITSYDPNTYPAKIEYLLTFMQWGYSAQHIGIAKGCVRGLDGLQSAIGDVYDNLHGGEFKEITLKDADGDELLCQEDLTDHDGEEWLMTMLVSAEIINIERYSFPQKSEGGAR